MSKSIKSIANISLGRFPDFYGIRVIIFRTKNPLIDNTARINFVKINSFLFSIMLHKRTIWMLLYSHFAFSIYYNWTKMKIITKYGHKCAGSERLLIVHRASKVSSALSKNQSTF